MFIGSIFLPALGQCDRKILDAKETLYTSKCSAKHLKVLRISNFIQDNINHNRWRLLRVSDLLEREVSMVGVNRTSEVTL